MSNNSHAMRCLCASKASEKEGYGGNGALPFYWQPPLVCESGAWAQDTHQKTFSDTQLCVDVACPVANKQKVEMYHQYLTVSPGI